MFPITVHTEDNSVWTVFFMGKIVKRVVFFAVLAACFFTGGMLTVQPAFQQEWIQLQIVANVDAIGEETIRGQIREAVYNSLQQALQDASDLQLAKEYIQAHLPEIEEAISSCLQDTASGDSVWTVHLREIQDHLDICVSAEQGSYQFRSYFLELLCKVKNFFKGD